MVSLCMQLAGSYHFSHHPISLVSAAQHQIQLSSYFNSSFIIEPGCTARSVNQLKNQKTDKVSQGNARETYKVKVISPRPKITGAIYYAHMHISLTARPQAHIGYVGINIIDTPESKIPCPYTSTPHGQSACIDWLHWHQCLGHRNVHKIPKVTVMAPRSKDTRPKLQTRAHLPLRASPLAQTGHIGMNTLGTGTSM